VYLTSHFQLQPRLITHWGITSLHHELKDSINTYWNTLCHDTRAKHKHEYDIDQ
jgi:hypothetical protein